jgi:hypothetical protein
MIQFNESERGLIELTFNIHDQRTLDSNALLLIQLLRQRHLDLLDWSRLYTYV